MEGIKQLKIEVLEQPPSTAEFASIIESRNVPAVFTGCVKNWRAFGKWDPANGGLDYLQERVGSANVEAMLSRSAPVFYGDLRSHERVPVSFSTFIDFCKQRAQNTDDARHTASIPLQGDELPVSNANQERVLSESMSHQVYLAQVGTEWFRGKVSCLIGFHFADLRQPPFLETKELMSINLWMNNSEARSSTHYDPHHNVLCVISGRKKVTLWPPSASPSLYPMPIYGEASNHSSVALEDPDFSLYPRAQYSMDYGQEVFLSAGDAIFIPEGWFHQVDSDNLTIAINFWWRSNIMYSMLEHMDAYYLRRILRRLTEKEMNQVLDESALKGTGKPIRCTSELLGDEKAEWSHLNLEQTGQRQELPLKDQQQDVKLNQLEPFALQALHELVSLVHDHVNLDQSQDNKTVTANLYFLEDDRVAKIIWSLDPQTLQNVLLAMVHSFPRTLEALVLHLLSPVGAEVLTRKFDEIDQQSTEEHRNKFYQKFYSAFDDQFGAMDAILNQKESFALQAFKETLEKYIGVVPNSLKPSVG
ncbi:unnamed protein product [Linum tenue]|uniref:JmjC domain-containing protein n=1 Tax=Linum tenue TaxID=586396 RepID=A0AAV0LKS5_9ROSI|nr:unnamed protein product [Linum tenue]